MIQFDDTKAGIVMETLNRVLSTGGEGGGGGFSPKHSMASFPQNFCLLKMNKCSY